jgi:hypothetical protein
MIVISIEDVVLVKGRNKCPGSRIAKIYGVKHDIIHGMNERRMILASVLVSIFLIGLILAAALYIDRLRDRMDHLYVIDEEYSSFDENGSMMIDISHDLEIGPLLGIPPRDNSSVHPLKPIEDRANYIDRKNLDIYRARVNDNKRNHTFGHYKFIYSVSCSRFDDITLRFRGRTDLHGQPSGLYFDDRNVTFVGGASSNLIYHNGSDLRIHTGIGYYPIDGPLVIVYVDCYLIEMELDYNAKPKPHEGGGFHLKQYIILDPQGDLMFFYNYRYDTGVLIFDTPWDHSETR